MLQNGPLPKYYQLAELLRGQITTGSLQPGDQLPTEDALCQQHRVSRGTVREAIRTLIDAGLIRREQGRGTFVTSVQPDTTLFTLTSFSDEVRRQNRHPSTQLLSAEIIAAPADVADKLALDAQSAVISIVRLRLVDGQPAVYESRYLAKHFCPGLLREDLVNDSIHRLLVQKYQIPLVKMTHTVEIQSLTADQAYLLQATPNDTAFFVDRLTYTRRDNQTIPAVWFQGIYREDHYNIQARVQPSL